MGYDVHITRKENWFDDGPEIGLQEWKTFIDTDDEMRLDGYAEAKLPGGHALRVDSDGLAVWTAFRGNTDGGNMAWFDYRSGNVVVKNPDVAILNKMWQIAQKLGARVQGDDCEIYGSDGSIVAS
ncbi:hypothetical protein PQR72_24430 [Paraburkholderia madseniana]|uniref:hypothetical protein n=1 Tax=Paraburkholderia madseniana TaxID=2599607 RepID=UPI0015C54442|nr:hypothetical protein [Paraburkholderia madseniana]NPT67397.1 hypothetical protein [Paraburkholderia madseniana]